MDPEPPQQHSNPFNNKILNSMTLKGTISGQKLKKRPGIFSNLFAGSKVSQRPKSSQNSSNRSRFPAAQSNQMSDGSKEDYSDLPPNQRKKKLTARIQDLQQKIQLETSARDGLMKMKVVYEANSVLGDPMTVEGQLNESSHKLEKLKQELAKFQAYLEQANAVQQNSPQVNRSQSSSQRTSR